MYRVHITTVKPVNKGIFPLDASWGLDERGYSPNLSYQLVWLSGLVTFAHAQQILEDIGQLGVATTTLWEQVHSHGARLHAHTLENQAHVSVERTRWHSQHYDPKMTRCVSIDGGMVCLREEGWKEMKVGLVSDFKTDWDSDPTSVKLMDMDYCAVIGDVNTFDPVLWALAVKHDVPYAGKLVVVCDGAPWIWRLVADLFPICHQILDYYHAKQHLAKMAQERFPTNDAQAQAWFRDMSDVLFNGQIFKIIADLQAHQLKTSYFVNHQRRMQYQQFRAEGLPIGSGGVESAIKQFKHRLTGAGMRWSRQGAERMITIRSAILADNLSDLWQRAA